MAENKRESNIDCLRIISMLMVVCLHFFSHGGLNDALTPSLNWAAGNLLLNILLVQRIGVRGVLLSTVICLVLINTVWGSRILFRHYFVGQRQTGYLLRILFYGAVAVLCCAVTSALCDRILLEGIGGLLCRLGTCLIVPNLLIPVLYARLPEFTDAKALARRVLSR